MNIEAPTGEALEKEFFGFSRDEVTRKIKRTVSRKQISFQDRVVETHKVQHILGWNPKNPSTKAAKALFERVRSNMGSQRDSVYMCCAIGTRLDFDHGTDLFFLCGDAVVTVDLTISPHGKPNAKAHVVITLDDLKNNRHYQLGDRIAQQLLKAA